MNYVKLLGQTWQDHLIPRAAAAPTVISIFAGCGGSSLGYSMAGYRELLAVEWGNNAADTFHLNFPEVPLFHGDVVNLSVEAALERCGLAPGELDVLDGSPPCQGFSTAGERIMSDPRNGLFQEYVRLLRGLRPKVFVMENVAGMVLGKMKLLFAEILRALKASGYQVSVRKLNAMYFDVPQSRERMIFIGVRDDLEFLPSHPVAQSGPRTVREAIQGLPLNLQLPELDHIWIDEVGRKTQWISRAAQLLPGEKICPHVASGTRPHLNRPAKTIQKNAHDGVAPYVRNSGIHPTEARTWSIREMARLQSFPDEFRFVDPLKNGMQRIGNSVPPLLMRAIAGHVASELARHA
jgi:DNA (cytosine-5)-methyltransferase 1